MSEVLGRSPSQIAYLAGAGISIPRPSALPSAAAFITSLANKVTDDPALRAAILDRTFVASADRRFVGDFLRFEAVMGAIKLTVDPGLEILRVFSECTAPNPYHEYLAQQIDRGATVLSTNFDNLIETACQTRGIAYSLVVNDDELAAFCEDPASFRNPLIKLHGGYDLMNSGGEIRQGIENVKTTIEQVGRVYLSGGSDHLASAMAAVIRTRHLVVMGYSGCDDFDIMPCFLKQPPVKGLTWIDHGEQPVEFLRRLPPDPPDLPPYRLLGEHGDDTFDVMIIRGRTDEGLGIDLGDGEMSQRYDWKEVFEAWSDEHLGSTAHRQLLTSQILNRLNRFEESAAILEGISRDALSDEQLGVLYFTLSCLYVYLNDAKRAILSLSEIADSEQDIDGVSLKGFAYYNLARINTDMNRYTEAEMYVNAAMKIFTKVGDLCRMGDCLHEAGRIYIGTGAIEKAVECVEAGIEHSAKTGQISGAAIGFNEIARALAAQGKLDEAQVFAAKAIHAFDLDGNHGGLGIAHHTLGYILAMRGDHGLAAREFRQAIEYERIAGAKLDLAHSLHSLGDMYMSMKELARARECLEEALQIKREIDDKQGIANSEALLAILDMMSAG